MFVKNLASDESTSENEDENGNRKNDINRHSRDALRIKLSNIVVFVFNSVSSWNFNDHFFVGKPMEIFECEIKIS